MLTSQLFGHLTPGIILCMCPANERWRYSVTQFLIDWAHKQIVPCDTWQWMATSYKHILRSVGFLFCNTIMLNLGSVCQYILWHENASVSKHQGHCWRQFLGEKIYCDEIHKLNVALYMTLSVINQHWLKYLARCQIIPRYRYVTRPGI